MLASVEKNTKIFPAENKTFVGRKTAQNSLVRIN